MSDERRFVSLPFGLTSFLSASLLFLIQPILSKCILPWFGGSKGVWTAAMLLFQTLLLLGYLYAHLSTHLSTLYANRPHRVWGLHLLVALTALFFLPLFPSPELRPLGEEPPTWPIVWLLIRTVGIPYFLLSATGPLAQTWLSKQGISPYRLYAVSNIGSLLALVLYPFLIEPLFSLQTQTLLWSYLFGLFVPLWLYCAWQGGRSKQLLTPPTGNSVDNPAQKRPGPTEKFLSILLPALASCTLLSTTEHLCEDVAVIPFMWVLPLSLYLLSFVFCFQAERLYHRVLFSLSAMVLAPVLLLSETFPQFLGPLLSHYAYARNLCLALGLLFTLCMLCHGEVMLLRPAPRFLTAYYLRISLGGVIGSVFSAVVLPWLLSQASQWNMTMAAGFCIALLLRIKHIASQRERIVTAGLCLCAGTAVVLVYWTDERTKGTALLARTRNFYGEIQIYDRKAGPELEHDRVMFHGGIIHGVQYQSPKYRRDPVTYFDEASGIGLTLSHYRKKPSLRVGVLGLGVGTLAAYAQPGHTYRFYELNPQVARFAQTYFGYLPDCQGRVSIILGDGRLSLEREASQHFDVLVLDAFSGDSVPTHLLTIEALRIYQKHLAPRGTLAVHITNRYLNLAPVALGLAQAGGWEAMRIRSPQDDPHEIYAADWFILTGDRELVEALRLHTSPVGKRAPVLWTDDRSPLFSLLMK